MDGLSPQKALELGYTHHAQMKPEVPSDWRTHDLPADNDGGDGFYVVFNPERAVYVDRLSILTNVDKYWIITDLNQMVVPQ